MLVMTTIEFRNPMMLFVLVKTYDAAIHELPRLDRKPVIRECSRCVRLVA